MLAHVFTEKSELRSRYIKERNELSIDLKLSYDVTINHSLVEFIQQQNFKTVHTYLPMGSEIDLYPTITWMLEHHIQVICPKVLSKRKLEHLELISLSELENGRWGTKHPSGGRYYTGNYDLILVPGLAYDKDKNRLGYGGGYYDTFLAQQKGVSSLGAFYAFQEVEKLPVTTYDTSLDKILTEKGWN